MDGDFVTRDNIESLLLRPLTTLETTYLPGLIEQAETKLRGRMPTLDARIALFNDDPAAPTGISPKAAAAVLAGVIKRVLVNKEGLWSMSQTSGPFGNSKTYPGSRQGDSSGDSPGTLTITDQDLAELTQPARFTLPGTIRTPVPCFDNVASLPPCVGRAADA